MVASEPDDAVCVGARVGEQEFGQITFVAEQPGFGADDNWVHEEAKLVEQVVSDERPDERAAAVDKDVFAVLMLAASATSPSITVVSFHSGDTKVDEATYMGVLLIQSEFGTSLPRSGHGAANVS